MECSVDWSDKARAIERDEPISKSESLSSKLSPGKEGLNVEEYPEDEVTVVIETYRIWRLRCQSERRKVANFRR